MQVISCFYNLRTNQTVAIFIPYSSHVSSVSIVTGLVYRVYEMGLIFWKEQVSSVFSKTSRAALESHLAFYSGGTWDSFWRGKEVGVKLTPYFHLVVRLWLSWALLPFSLCAFTVCTRTMCLIFVACSVTVPVLWPPDFWYIRGRITSTKNRYHFFLASKLSLYYE